MDRNSSENSGAQAASLTDFGDEPATAPPAAKEGAPLRLAYAVGSAGILAATAADALGVAGRHTGVHLLGSIELVQAAVVVLAASSMFIVTVVGGHASVHILTERLGPAAAKRMARVSAFASAIVFLLLAAGSIQVAVEMWPGHELTELLHIPLRWLRIVWICFALLIAGAFLRIALRGGAR